MHFPLCYRKIKNKGLHLCFWIRVLKLETTGITSYRALKILRASIWVCFKILYFSATSTSWVQYSFLFIRKWLRKRLLVHISNKFIFMWKWKDLYKLVMFVTCSDEILQKCYASYATTSVAHLFSKKLLHFEASI